MEKILVIKKLTRKTLLFDIKYKISKEAKNGY